MQAQEIQKYVNQSVLCWLATASKEGMPNVSPKELFVFDGDSTLYIANIASPHSIRNILENEWVCVSFVDVFVQKGCKLKGKALVIKRNDPEYATAVKPLAEMAGEKFKIASVIKVSITEAKPIIAPSYLLYPETTEEDQIANSLKTYKVPVS